MTDSNRIAVVPAADTYVGVIKHPIDGPLKKDGCLWTYDGFTCRLLTDGVIFKARLQPAPAKAAASPMNASATPEPHTPETAPAA